MKSILVVLSAFVFSFQLSAQLNILDLRENFNVGQTVTISGIVTNGAELSSIRYIQDDFAGIAIYPGSNWNAWDFEPAIGDEITVSGELTEYNGLLEVGSNLFSVTLESQGNNLPEPQLITPNQMGEEYEGELVTVMNCVFSNGGSPIVGNSTYSYTSDGEQGVVFFRNGHPMIDAILPIGPVGLVGIASQFTFDGTGGYQLLPRTEEDIIQDSNINLVSAVDQTDITTTGFTLSWGTDVAGNSSVEYGLTPALGTTVTNEESVTSHSVAISDLMPGTIYYAKVTSSDGVDTAESGIMPYATVSESSGAMYAYFTGSVDNTVATIEEAWSTGSGTNDTIAAYIDRAEYTLDCAIYNINDQTIVNAINDAYDRGVQIRYISQGTNANIGLAQFNSGIPVWERTDDNGSGMHNKFMIIDADYTDQAVLLTGSTNWTPNNLQEDFNNMIIFHDQSIARGYRLEFEEMWGGDDVMPNTFESKFSSDKTVNTPRKYVVSGSPVEVYFSPTDNTTQAIKEAILTANANLDFALLSFTRDDLAEAVIDRNNDFFTYVRGIIEQTSGSGNEYDVLTAEGVEVYSHESITYQIHHKYAIVDHLDNSSDPLVITGSHNWSTSAENVNDENTVIVHDERIANLFYQEFKARYSVFNSIEEQAVSFELEPFPNPTDDIVQIPTQKWAAGTALLIEIFDMQGRSILREQARASSMNSINLNSLPAGFYQLKLSAEGKVGTAKIAVK